MGKLVTLKFSDGNFEQGFTVTIQIGEEGAHPSSEISASLPPFTELPQLYDAWQALYLSMELPSRLFAAENAVTHVSFIEDCYDTAEKLTEKLNQWLQSPSFLPARELLSDNIQRMDEVRVLLQSGNSYLQRMPWHLWDLFDRRYHKAEIAIAAPSYSSVEPVARKSDKIRILVILGNSEGIDVSSDRAMLEQLPNAEVTFLVEPKRQQLNDELWQQHWDILFFAGHSDTQQDIGRIYINETESLRMEQLRYALRTAVTNGLRLAIFNSCDGLGLARSLFDLHIPQVIVMREPIPDLVAQQFLRHFLEAFSSGTSCYLSVRRARERLQGIEDQFPCATWLPIICQNPAEIPLKWSIPEPEKPPIQPAIDVPPPPIGNFNPPQVNTSNLDRNNPPSNPMPIAIAPNPTKNRESPMKRKRLFRLPQTYILLAGTAIGLTCFIALLRPRPIVLASGGAIAAIVFGAWSWQVKQEFAWLNENNLLDREVFGSKLEALERTSLATGMQWRRAKAWAKETHTFAEQIVEKEPDLTVEVLETLDTVLALAEQVTDAIAAASQVRSENYRVLAQRRLQASYDRLQATHELLQNLQDQVLLLSLDRNTSNLKVELPAQLRLAIDTNKITLQANEK
ncbi:CHAT domain-containing protein [Tumidithrix elongata RA019]|uniref:CHAT domain-containing protein n=1 Tax=Tumidithrix elongata BACA0141 TaxID=2716417 RepID=A0AAW9Q038_9CYAN|nr:CHAT domain-containing protein [Tumidithrix elongata RA019]